MNNYKMLKRQKYREEAKRVELLCNSKICAHIGELFNPSKFGSRVKLRPIMYESVRNSSYSLLNTDSQNSARFSHKYHNKNRNPIIMNNDNSFCNKILQLKESLNLLQNKYELRSSQISKGGVLLSHRLSRASEINKNSKLAESSIFIFKLPTEKSYNQVNKLFRSIKSLMKDATSEKDKKVRTNTADTDATELQKLHSKRTRTLQSERSERNFKARKQPLEENKVSNELEYLKSTADEEMELLPALLTGSECRLRLAVTDIMTCV